MPWRQRGSPARSEEPQGRRPPAPDPSDPESGDRAPAGPDGGTGTGPDLEPFPDEGFEEELASLLQGMPGLPLVEDTETGEALEGYLVEEAPGYTGQGVDGENRQLWHVSPRAGSLDWLGQQGDGVLLPANQHGSARVRAPARSLRAPRHPPAGEAPTRHALPAGPRSAGRLPELPQTFVGSMLGQPHLARFQGEPTETTPTGDGTPDETGTDWPETLSSPDDAADLVRNYWADNAENVDADSRTPGSRSDASPITWEPYDPNFDATARVATRRRPRLEEFRLSTRGTSCTDLGVLALCRSLPDTLRVLHLDLARTKLSKRGLATLGSCAGGFRVLEELQVDVSEPQAELDDDVLPWADLNQQAIHAALRQPSLHIALPEISEFVRNLRAGMYLGGTLKLKRLHLSSRGLRVSSESLVSLGQQLFAFPELEELVIDVSWCQVASLAGLAPVLDRVKRLHVKAESCPLDDEGVRPLLEALDPQTMMARHDALVAETGTLATGRAVATGPQFRLSTRARLETFQLDLANTQVTSALLRGGDWADAAELRLGLSQTQVEFNAAKVFLKAHPTAKIPHLDDLPGAPSDGEGPPRGPSAWIVPTEPWTSRSSSHVKELDKLSSIDETGDEDDGSDEGSDSEASDSDYSPSDEDDISLDDKDAKKFGWIDDERPLDQGNFQSDAANAEDWVDGRRDYITNADGPYAPIGLDNVRRATRRTTGGTPPVASSVDAAAAAALMALGGRGSDGSELEGTSLPRSP